MSLTGEIEHLRQEWQDALGYLLGYIDEEQWEDAIVSYGDASRVDLNLHTLTLLTILFSTKKYGM